MLQYVKLSISNHTVGLVHKKHVINEIYNKHVQRTCLMYHAACKVEFQSFNRSYSQLTFFFNIFHKICAKKLESNRMYLVHTVWVWDDTLLCTAVAGAPRDLLLFVARLDAYLRTSSVWASMAYSSIFNNSMSTCLLMYVEYFRIYSAVYRFTSRRICFHHLVPVACSSCCLFCARSTSDELIGLAKKATVDPSKLATSTHEA